MGEGVYLLKDGEVAMIKKTIINRARQTLILSSLTGIWMYLAHIT